MTLPLDFVKRKAIILQDQQICPFNSQNTTWFKPAFALLYLPSTCRFRLCDIWRSFIVQRILWCNNWSLSFHSANVVQLRNQHDLLDDLAQETEGYLYNEIIVELLGQLDLPQGEEHIHTNLRRCYEVMCDNGFFEKKELNMLEAWLLDLKTIDKA
jgi:hypothetical protein